MTQPYRLHYAPDNASMIVRLCLLELDVPFETVLVDRTTMAHKGAAYTALNPNGLIPTLETDAGPLFETGAILLFLADRHGGLFPLPDAPDRGALLKWLFYVSNTLQPAMRCLVYPHLHIGEGFEAPLIEHTKTRLIDYLDVLEAQAATGVFFQAAPTIIDFYLACCLRWLGVYPRDGTDWFDLYHWPHLAEGCAQLEARASVQTAILAEGIGAHPFTDPNSPLHQKAVYSNVPLGL